MTTFPYPQPWLPTETWEKIFSQLTHPGDLYNVSLTSRFVHNIANPILYSRLSLAVDYYATYTLSLLKCDLALAHRVQKLTLLPPIRRDIPPCILAECEALYRTLDIPYPSDLYSKYRGTTPVASGDPDLSIDLAPPIHLVLPDVPIPGEPKVEYIRPIFHFFPSFTGLISLHIVRECVPTDFFQWIHELPQLTTLDIRESYYPEVLLEKDRPTPLPLRTLCILGGYRIGFSSSENDIPGKICSGLLKNAPLLTSLRVDLFLERAACLVLSEMDHPPPIQTFSCHGMGSLDPGCTLFCAVIINLPTITNLQMNHIPRELQVLPDRSLPQLRSLTGRLKPLTGTLTNLGLFFGMHRPLQYLTIINGPSIAPGTTPWETRLICFFETLWKQNIALKGLTFKLMDWSEEVFLCVCQLWPGLRELRIRCNGDGVDEYFRISFGPRFLPQLQNLEVLHIWGYLPRSFIWRQSIRGPFIDTRTPFIISPEEAEQLAEEPNHYRRWEKICPSLREVAFDQHLWWRRVFSERGAWTLMREDVLNEQF